MTDDATSCTKRPTILEVARVAGVSHQTVSRFLRFHGEGLKPSTRERVSAAIDELGYRPNLVARSMRTRRTGRLAVLLPTVAFNPARMLSGATDVAHDAGFSVDVMSYDGGAASRADRLLDLVEWGQVEGVLSFAPVDADVVERLPPGTAVTVAAELDDQMRGIGELADGSAIVTIIERLAELGHRRFLHVAGAPNFASARSRRGAYLETIERLALDSLGVHDGDWSGESGVAAVEALPDDAPPLAVIAANDLVAAGVISAASRRGWRIPQDISVTGWDDTALAPFLLPPLTSVEVDLERIGRNAMAGLIATIRGAHAEVDTRPVSRVVWRDSAGPPGRG